MVELWPGPANARVLVNLVDGELVLGPIVCGPQRGSLAGAPAGPMKICFR